MACVLQGDREEGAWLGRPGWEGSSWPHLGMGRFVRPVFKGLLLSRPLMLSGGQGRGTVPTEASQARAVQTRDRSPVPCPQEASTAPRSCRSFADPCLRPHPQHLDSGWGSGLVGQGGRGEGRGPAHLSEFGFCLLQTNLRPANSLCSEETGSLPPACTRGNLAVPLEEGHQCPDHRGRADPTPPSHTHRHLWSPSCRMCWGYRPWRAAGGQLPHEVLVREGCSFPCRGPCCWAGLGWGTCRGAGHPAP